MYDAPQCKVLIAGQSYMKCMELKRMLNWAEEGFRLVLEQNICSCETPLERVNPDILILVGITGWMDVKVIIDSFAKKHNLGQIIVVCDEKNPLGLSNQIRFLPSAVTPELLRSTLRAIKEALTAAVPGDFSSGQVGQARDLLLQYAARVPSSRLVIARLCLEQPCQTPAASLRLEEAFRRYLNPEAFFYQESVFSYCFLLGLSAVSIRDQLQLIEYALRKLRGEAGTMLHCRAALFLSDLADPTSVVSEYETLLALEPQRFFCDDWLIISRALCEQSYAPLPDHAALSALQMELMQATLSGSGDKIIRLLHTLYRNNLKRSRDLKAFRVAEAQLREVLGCIYSISRRPMDSAPAQEPALWSIEDAMERQIHAFRRAIPLQSKESGSLSPLVLRTLELLTQRHDQTVYVSAISAELGVTDSHLSRSFKQQLGIGIAEYIRYVRVYAAAAELCTGDARIRDVAEHHGFSDSKYFSKVFHQVLGLTPSQWLQRHAQSGAAQEVLA